ncbi:MAG: hypothetical protein Q8Q50_05035 [Methylobacter sp.]|nr:hypothetical protein [Methylobacter sp.]
MRLLLDTHAFLWLNDDNPKLSQKIREFCLSGEHSFYLSIASAWEIQIKVQLGKLRDYAKAKGIAEEEALKLGMDEKSQQFLDEGADIYHKV